eukprot:gene13910-15359_t
MASELYIRTPLIESVPISKICGLNVYLKLENTQPSGSFKLRGLANHCLQDIKRGCKHLVCSSGGNAGMAVGYIGRHLSVPVTIVVPETTTEEAIARIKDEGANVIVHGKVWDDANEHAKKLIESNELKDGSFIHPFDHPEIWEGHSSMILEAKEQLNVTPDLVVLAVGGGGLLSGVLEGMHKVGWSKVPLLTVETFGADSFASAVQAGKVVTLPGISSIAKCLGAVTVCEKSLDWTKNHDVISHVLNDKEAVDACLRFLDDHKMLVQPACGAALAAVYGNAIKTLQEEKKLGDDIRNVLVIVCGGQGITIKKLLQLKEQFNL